MVEYKTSEAKRRANRKYAEKHREKNNETRRITERNNPEVVRARSKRNYEKRKMIREGFKELAALTSAISCH